MYKRWENRIGIAPTEVKTVVIEDTQIEDINPFAVFTGAERVRAANTAPADNGNVAKRRELMEIGLPFEKIVGKDVLDKLEAMVGSVVRDVGESGKELDFNDKDAIDICLKIVGKDRLAEIKSLLTGAIEKVTRANERQELDLYDEDAVNIYAQMCALYRQMEEHGV